MGLESGAIQPPSQAGNDGSLPTRITRVKYDPNAPETPTQWDKRDKSLEPTLVPALPHTYSASLSRIPPNRYPASTIRLFAAAPAAE